MGCGLKSPYGSDKQAKGTTSGGVLMLQAMDQCLLQPTRGNKDYWYCWGSPLTAQTWNIWLCGWRQEFFNGTGLSSRHERTHRRPKRVCNLIGDIDIGERIENSNETLTTEPQVRAVSMHVSVSSVGGTNIGKNNTRVSYDKAVQFGTLFKQYQ